MKSSVLVLAAVGLCPFAAGSVFAQQAPTQPGPAAVTSTPATPAPAPRSGPTGSLHMSHGDWRTSQVVGATVFNEHGDNIGTVDDLLMGNNGQVSDAVLSVGGFLGIGAKLVSVPFSQLKFERSKTGFATAGATGSPGAAGGMVGAPGAMAPAAGGAGAPGTAAGGGVGGNPAAAPAMTGAPAGNAAGEGHAPADYSLVLPGATKDSLTTAPEFKFGS